MTSNNTQITTAQGATYSTGYWFTCPDDTIDRGKKNAAVNLKISWATVVIALFVYSVSGIEIGGINLNGFTSLNSIYPL